MKEIRLRLQQRFPSILFTTLAILTVVFGSWSCSPAGYSGPVESITLGTELLESSIPVFVAEGQQFFTRNGLKVTMKYYDTGLSAVNGMLKGEVDISYPVADYVLVGKVFNKENIQTMGSLDKVDWVLIVARKDRGIVTISDLKGKRIGVIRETLLEFFLGRFLELHDISMKDLTLVSMATFSQSVDAIVSGDIDAVISVPPYTATMREKLGGNVLALPAQSSQMVHQLLICRREWVAQHAALTERLLKAIDQAEEYIFQHPDEAKAIAQKRLNFTEDAIARVWSQNQFSLTLDQALIAAMEDEARWMISNNLTTEKQVPDFLDYIYEDAAKVVKPEAVKIIR